MYEFPWFEEDSEERASWSASMRESSSNMRVFICDTCVMFCYLCFYYYWNQQVYPIFRQVVRLNTQSDPADKSSKHNTHTHTCTVTHKLISQRLTAAINSEFFLKSCCGQIRNSCIMTSLRGGERDTPNLTACTHAD